METADTAGGAHDLASTFRDLFAGFEAALVHTDPDGRILACNDAFATMIRRDPSQVIGAELPYPWLAPDQLAWFVAQLGRSMRSAAARGKFEGALTDAGGTRFDVVGSVSALVGADGQPESLLFALRDAESLRSAIRALAGPARHRELDGSVTMPLKRLFDSGIIGIITGVEDRILHANDAFLETVGYDRSDVEDGMDWPALTPPEFLELDARAGEEMLRNGFSPPIEKQYFRKDGSRVWIRIAGAALEWEPFTWVSFVEDISQQKAAEEELRTALDRERAAASSRATLMHALAHDIRNPLTVVSGLAETLALHAERLPHDDVRSHLERISAQARAALQLTADLLDAERVELAGVDVLRERTDVGAIATEIASRFAPGAHPIEVDAPAVVADVDPARVRRIVENLVANAVAHTPESTPVWIRVGADEDGGVLVAVEDGGPGVPDPLKHKVFEAFRTAGAERGTGLGLSIVARLAEDHGGRAWVEDRPGGGSSFKVHLPAA